MNRLLVVVAAVLVAAAAVQAQIVTQPPVSAPRIDEFIPKPPPPPPAPPPQPIQSRPVKAPLQPLPDLPYEKLAKLDAAGKVLPLNDPIDLAALKVNPHVPKEVLEKIKPTVESRRPIFEKLVIENLDLVEQIDAGAFENAKLADNKAIAKLLELCKPLRSPAAPKRLPEVLTDDGVITKEQAAFNAKIANEYSLASVPASTGDAAAGSLHAKMSLAILYKQGVDEALFTHRVMCLEASEHLAKTLPQLGLDKAVESKAVTQAKALNAGMSQSDRLAAFREIVGGLTVDQRRELFRKTLALRGGA